MELINDHNQKHIAFSRDDVKSSISLPRIPGEGQMPAQVCGGREVLRFPGVYA